MQPDGNFPTVNLPNPEDPAAFTMALDLAKNIQADIVLASDPDSDRTGVYARTPNGDYAMLNGNQIGVLLLERIIESHNMRKMMPVNPFVVSTVVSTRLTKQICETNNIEYIDVLTGFKFIGEKIMELDERGDKNFLFGFEESYGCLIGDYARDKDGIAAVMALCEAACYYKSKGKTLWDAMNDIYEKYGYYKETQVSIVMEGAEGAQKIKDMMTNMRNTDIEKIGDYKVLTFKDVDKDIVKNMQTGEVTKTGLPKSNVLYYELENNSWCCVRPVSYTHLTLPTT